jgi:hypothetical protein
VCVRAGGCVPVFVGGVWRLGRVRGRVRVAEGFAWERGFAVFGARLVFSVVVALAGVVLGSSFGCLCVCWVAFAGLFAGLVVVLLRLLR